MDEPPRRAGPPEPDRQAMDDFDDVDRITRAVAHWGRWGLVVGFPVWLVLLVLVPRVGLGAIGSLALSTLAASIVVVAAERVGRRRAGAPDAAGTPARAPRRRRPMSAPVAVALTLGGVVLVAYVVFIVVTILRGG